LLNVTTDAAIAPVSATANLPAMADVKWRIVGTGDYNGDGKADLLWRHGIAGESATGAVSVWLMNGAAVLGTRGLGTLADLNWQVAGSGDFDGDGKADIVWRHGVSGANYLWLLNVSTDAAVAPVRSTAAISTIADLKWRIVGVADFNGDGKADLLWRHGVPGESATGASSVWLMSGATLTKARNLGTVADLNWRVGGTGDFDADGKADIVWRHAVNGGNSVWLMNVTADTAIAAVKSATSIAKIADVRWRIVGTGDYNGDGKADLLWRHGIAGETASGANSVWLMNGAGVLGTRALGTVSDLNWQPAP
jgi:hypothetical protein